MKTVLRGISLLLLFVLLGSAVMAEEVIPAETEVILEQVEEIPEEAEPVPDVTEEIPEEAEPAADEEPAEAEPAAVEEYVTIMLFTQDGGDDVYYGDVVTLRAMLFNVTCAYKVVWEVYDDAEAEWVEIFEGDAYTFIATRSSVEKEYRAKVYLYD